MNKICRGGFIWELIFITFEIEKEVTFCIGWDVKEDAKDSSCFKFLSMCSESASVA